MAHRSKKHRLSRALAGPIAKIAVLERRIAKRNQEISSLDMNAPGAIGSYTYLNRLREINQADLDLQRDIAYFAVPNRKHWLRQLAAIDAKTPADLQQVEYLKKNPRSVRYPRNRSFNGRQIPISSFQTRRTLTK